MQQVSDSVFVETGFTGCNVGLVVTADGLVMIDSPHCPSDALKWREQLAEKGRPLYLINTEHHVDHVTGNGLVGGTVIGTEYTRKALEGSAASEGARQRILERWPETASLVEGFKLAIPAITFSERASLFVGGKCLHLIRLPGHAPSGLAVHLPDEGVVFTGDNVVFRQGPLFQEALPTRWFDSLDKLEALGAKVIVPGHGSVCAGSYVAEFRREVEETLEAVRDAIARGLTREEAAEQIDLLSRYEAHRGGVPEMASRLQRLGVKRLYGLLTGEITEE